MRDRFWSSMVPPSSGSEALPASPQMTWVEPGMVVGITGHRDLPEGFCEPLREWFVYKLREHRPERAISGMALGADQLFAEACIEAGVPFAAAVPAIWQADRWTDEQRRRWVALLDRAQDVVIVSPPDVNFFTAMRLRDEWVVDHSTEMWGVYDGRPRGGTHNTLKYAGRGWPKCYRMVRYLVDPRRPIDVPERQV